MSLRADFVLGGAHVEGHIQLLIQLYHSISYPNSLISSHRPWTRILLLMSDDPSYDELLEENYELHEERKNLLDRVRSLENDLAEERNAGLDNKRRASEIERLQTIASRARAEAEDFKRGAIKHQGERETWARERERLETALRDKEDR